MVTYDARPSAFTQLTSTADWESLLSVIGVPEAAVDGSGFLGHWMAPSLDTGGRNAVIDAGQCVIKGQLWRCDASVSTPIPAASAQNRIDRLVLRLTRGAATSAAVVAPAVVTGTPSGSPALPALTQTPTGIWEYPVCHWTSTSAGALQSLTDDRRITNDSWHDMRPLTGSFVGSISGYTPPQYRFSDDCQFVEIAGYVQSPGTAGNYNSTVFATLPPPYRPQTASGTRWFASGAADGVATPVVQVINDGTLQMHFLPTSLAGATIMGIGGRYPLEDTAGFLQT